MDGDGGGIGLHAAEDDDEHLDEGSLGSGLVDGIAAVEVEVVAGANDAKEGVPVDAEGGGGDGG